ncbi:MAG: hypothetical protein EHM61_09730 [Acidobacteria bacterium]|nr:MAG: hypothetical protein EHM61_09730 [Acidobacteriota bacterium]
MVHPTARRTQSVRRRFYMVGTNGLIDHTGESVFWAVDCTSFRVQRMIWWVTDTGIDVVAARHQMIFFRTA